MLRVIAIVALLVAVARADDDTNINGFVAYGAGPLSGRVVDAANKPMAGVRVHAMSKSAGDKVVMTDKDGGYKIDLAGAPGEASLVFVRELGAHIAGETAVTIAAGSDGEAIEVQATVQPAVMAQPKTNPAMIPEYSDELADKNAWTKAWLLLDIDATGAVTELKFLKRPGYKLDGIAMKTAFKLKFEPARDRANHPIRSLLVWSFEWPSWFWLQRLHHDMSTPLPEFVTQVPCQRGTEHHAEYRDCSGPDFSRGLVESWIKPRR